MAGDPTNGTRTYGYDPLARLTSSTDATTTTYGWDKVPNRASVQVGANPAVTTTYDDANRPVSDSAGGAYGSDEEGRLTARPDQTMTWDTLGRLTQVKNAAGTVTLATYTYDPLDRLRTVARAGTTIRFRYVGLTTSAAQVVDHGTSAVIRHIGTDWTGGRLLDWTGSGSNLRVYGTNGHHDVTWTADGTGAVTNTLRYGPFGETASTTGASVPDFRYQGNWFDTTTSLSWIITRWYAPSLGRFISEDTLLGEPTRPPSRHLYAYAEGEPIGHWDPDGRMRLRFFDWIPISSTYRSGAEARATYKTVSGGFRMEVFGKNTHNGRVQVWAYSASKRVTERTNEWKLNVRAADLWASAGITSYVFGGATAGASVRAALYRTRDGVRTRIGNWTIFDFAQGSASIVSVGDVFHVGPFSKSWHYVRCYRCGTGPGALRTNDRVQVVVHFDLFVRTAGAMTATGRMQVEGLKATLIER